MSDRLTGKERILEIGCGNGRDARHFASRGHPVVALDTSGSAIGVCLDKRVVAQTEYRNARPEELIAERIDPFDVVYSRFCLHTMTESEELELLHAARQLLKPGGIFFAECRSCHDPIAKKGEALSATETLYGHYRRFIVLDRLAQNLANVGFQVQQAVQSDGLALLGDENPVVIRVQAAVLEV